MRTHTTMSPRACVAAGTALVALLCVAEPVRAEPSLPDAVARLLPYDPGGTTLAALADLGRLTRSVDRSTATTAAFMRAAAAVELLAFADLGSDGELRAGIARALGAPPAELTSTIDAELARFSSGGFRQQAAAWRVVLSCLERDDTARCDDELRAVADSGSGAATAARLSLIRAAGHALAAARSAPRGRSSRELLAAGRALCATARHRSVRQRCRAAGSMASPSTIELARALLLQASLDAGAIRRSEADGDALARLVTPWLARAEEELGWLATSAPLEPDRLPAVSLPSATGEPSRAPLALLMIGEEGVYLAAAPLTVVTAEGSADLAAETGAPLPGRRIMSLPADFPGLIRPIPQLTAALADLREQIEGALPQPEDRGPAWVAEGRGRLGVLASRSLSLVDLARFLASAREAGYERVSFFGARADGRLAAVSADVTVAGAARATPAMPLLRVAPGELLLENGGGATRRFSRTGERDAAAAAAASLLEGDARCISVRGRPMMPFGLVFPVLEAVVEATDEAAGAARLLLPQ